LAIELRIVPRARNGPNVHQPLNSMALKQIDEIVNRPRRMADGQNQRRCCNSAGMA
jgi:hypothetical protein